LGKIHPFPSKFEFPWEKKKRGGGKVDGLSAGRAGHGRYQGAGHRWPEPRQERKPTGWLEREDA